MQKILGAVLSLTWTCLGCSLPVGSEAREMASTAPASKAEPTLCRSHETVVFSCRIRRSGKLASICATGDLPVRADASAYYAFGKPGAIELRFPPDTVPATQPFKRTQLVFAGATGGYAYTFTNGDFKYYVYSISGTGLEDQGVAVRHRDKIKGELQCDPRTVVLPTDTRVIDALLEWPEDPDVAQRGLP